jgi:hypothetical protein
MVKVMNTDSFSLITERRQSWLVAMSVLLIWLSAAGPVAAQNERLQATAPDNHVEFKDTRSGSYFIAKPLKEKYDGLLARLKNLRTEIDAGRISGVDAQRQLASLQVELQELRDLIQKSMKHVSAAFENKTTETMKFELGPEKCLVITGDNARIIGWDKPYVQCELEKIVLSKSEMPVDDDFKTLQVVHQHGKAEGLVGKTAAEYQAEEEQFLASEDGKKLNDTQREFRRKLVDSIHSQYSIFQDFQGKEIDTIHVVGLTGQEGNRQITLQLTSNVGQSLRSEWVRHARLTVYVPKTTALATRGGLEYLDIQNVQSALVITSQGSHNRDYEGEYKVQGVEGSVVVDDAPITLVENVSGNVTILSTMDYANSGTQHEGDSRIHYFYPALPCTCKDIRGDLTGWFSRVSLNVQGVSGKIDVRNEFGDTTLTPHGKLAVQCHRLISEAGRIELIVKADELGDLPLFAMTQCGTVRTNASRELLDSVSLSGADDQAIMRHWSGFRRPPPPGEFDFIHPRFSAAINGEDREPAVDVISRGGTVVVTVSGE